jgi:tetratricopeptide (TPR) repeat protein
LVAVTVSALIGWQSLWVLSAVGNFPKYPVAAAQLIRGFDVPERILDYSPLYLVLHRFAVSELAEPARALLAVQAACVGLGSAFFFIALRRHVGLGLALSGTAAQAFERSVAVFGFIFEPEALLLLFVAAWLCFAQRPKLVDALAAGTALSLALLTRPGLLVLAPLTPVAYFWREDTADRARKAAFLFLLPVILGLALLSARNGRSVGSWSPVVMNPGTVFFDGNSPYSYGYGASYPPIVKELAASHQPAESDFNHEVYRRLARLDAGSNLSVAEVNRFWSGKALRFLRDEPLAAARRVVRKLFFAVHAYRWYDINMCYLAERSLQERRIPATPLALVSALALVGLGLSFDRRRELFPVAALFAAQLALMLMNYASARQRIVLLPALVVFACVALSRLVALRHRGLCAAGILVLALCLGRETDLMKDHRHARDPHRAATDGPEAPASRLDLAMRRFGEGRYDEAAALFLKLRRERYETVRGEPSYFLGWVAARAGRRDEAVNRMREALVEAPGHPTVLAALAVLTGEPVWRERLSRYVDALDARYELAHAYLLNGQSEQGAAELREVVLALPDLRTARQLLDRTVGAQPAGD